MIIIETSIVADIKGYCIIVFFQVKVNMRINDNFSIYDGRKNPTEEFENQMVDLRTPSYWDKFKTWQKPYQALFLSILTLIVVGIVIYLCLHFLGSEGK